VYRRAARPDSYEDVTIPDLSPSRGPPPDDSETTGIGVEGTTDEREHVQLDDAVAIHVELDDRRQALR